MDSNSMENNASINAGMMPEGAYNATSNVNSGSVGVGAANQQRVPNGNYGMGYGYNSMHVEMEGSSPMMPVDHQYLMAQYPMDPPQLPYGAVDVQYPPVYQQYERSVPSPHVGTYYPPPYPVMPPYENFAGYGGHTGGQRYDYVERTATSMGRNYQHQRHLQRQKKNYLCC